MQYGEDSSIFNTLLHFTKNILLDGYDLLCEFSQLLRWRELSSSLGEDLFTTAHLAYLDVLKGQNRHFFAWLPTISSNNWMLNTVFNKGLSELHFHLFGSSLNFHIGWLSLMNDITNRKIDFLKLYKSKLSLPNIHTFQKRSSFYTLYVKAYTIRLYLFMKLIKIDNADSISFCIKQNNLEANSIDNLLHNVLRSTSDDDVSLYVSDLHHITIFLKQLCGRKYSGECVDYAIRTKLAERNYEEGAYPNVILTGERWIMYKMFTKIYSRKNGYKSLSLLFYAYLIIKSQIRHEFVQLNSLHGFANFQEYQNRSCLFIKSDSVYEKLLINSAVTNTFINQRINYLEARVSPTNSLEKNVRIIKHYDKLATAHQFVVPTCNFNYDSYAHRIRHVNIEKISTDNFYYIFHFIKKPNYEINYIKNVPSTILKPRLYKLRNEVRVQAQVLFATRKKSAISKRIVGVDAANSEIGVRPEIFAQAFRYLKNYEYEDLNYMLRSSHKHSFGYTYHVGEDFLDIADGLRAVDEVIKFLNFGRGDRIGHGLVLGIDANTYYARRKNCIVLPKLDYLDNIAWILMQIKLYSIQASLNLLQELNDNYWRLYSEIYMTDNHIPPHIYYQSWLLRGDNPEIYTSVDHGVEVNDMTLWDRCAINKGYIYDAARRICDARKLYIYYHFNEDVKVRGSVIEEFKVSPEYIKLISDLQQKMRIEIAEQHIAIETNPTSNLKIGEFSRYIDHPITKFYNTELEQDIQKTKECPQISVSINTDDLGVFDTNLENEYALLAIALEKEKEGNGNKKYQSRHIYNWLESIRQMGEEQRFVKE